MSAAPRARSAAPWAKPHRLRIAPSILSADFSRLKEEIERVEGAGADFLHLDVMDGQFVPNLTFGPLLVEAIRRLTALPLDVHLMVVDPIRFVEPFAKAGSDHLTVHVETLPDPVPAARAIRARGLRAGLSLRPRTPLESFLRALPEYDIALIMTVEPGAGGQAFLDGSIERISAVRAAIDAGGLDCLLEVDGGISAATAPAAARAGADTFVAGHSIFHAADPASALAELRQSVSLG